MVDNSINPDHYKASTSLECIEAMEIIFGPEKVIDFCACNAWKYIWRWKNKNGKEDLEKALWYVHWADGLCVKYSLPCDPVIPRMFHYIHDNLDKLP